MNPSKQQPDSTGSTILNVGFFRHVMDTITESVQIFKAIRTPKNTITGFEILYSNRKALELFPDHHSGRILPVGKAAGKESDLIGRLQKAVETGIENVATYELAAGKSIALFDEKIEKLNDGAFVMHQAVHEESAAAGRRIDMTKHHSLLKQSEELAGFGSWEYDCHTKELIWSDGMYRLFEMPLGTPIKPSVYLDYVIPEDRHIAQKMREVIEEHCEPMELTLRIKPGNTIRTLHIKATSLKDQNNKLLTILGIDIDITTSLAAEERIQTLNKTLSSKNRELENVNSELKTFNNIAANDYKETLRSLYINLENVIKSDASDMSDSGKANIRKAQTAIQKMKLLTEDIVSFSRIPMLDSSIMTVNLNGILQSSISDLNHKIQESGAKIEGQDLPIIQGMPILLTLLFYHLLDNAIKFRHNGKAPVIKVIGTEADSTAQSDSETHYKVISITDNGIGFDGKDSEKLFSIFFRLHERSEYRGSGIGLAVCRKIMALHGGFITAEGVPGDGTIIKCFFPTESF
jgi:signal transduction histidine kinase